MALKVVPHPQSAADLQALLPNPGQDGWLFFEDFGQRPAEPTTDHRKVNAWWTMETAYLSYATDAQFALDQLHRVGLEGATFGFDRPTPPHILVAHNAGIVMVAFRGTRVDQLADVLADAAFLPVFNGQGFVHHGFQSTLASNDVWDQARRYVQGIAGSQVILFTGHSLGAALTTLARRGYSDPAGRAVALYTFGSPRVGDQLLYCPGYPGPAYRTVNEEDAVTHIPTPPIYGHIGTPLDCTGAPLPVDRWEQLEHQFAVLGAALSVFSLESRKERLRQSFANLVKPLADHAPKSYAARLWNALAS